MRLTKDGQWKELLVSHWYDFPANEIFTFQELKTFLSYGHPTHKHNVKIIFCFV